MAKKTISILASSSSANLVFRGKLGVADDKQCTDLDVAEYRHIVRGFSFNIKGHRAKLMDGKVGYARTRRIADEAVEALERDNGSLKSALINYGRPASKKRYLGGLIEFIGLLRLTIFTNRLQSTSAFSRKTNM